MANGVILKSTVGWVNHAFCLIFHLSMSICHWVIGSFLFDNKWYYTVVFLLDFQLLSSIVLFSCQTPTICDIYPGSRKWGCIRSIWLTLVDSDCVVDDPINITTRINVNTGQLPVFHQAYIFISHFYSISMIILCHSSSVSRSQWLVNQFKGLPNAISYCIQVAGLEEERSPFIKCL